MPNRRLLFTVIIKLLIVAGLILLSWVFINSLFVHDGSPKTKANIDIPVIKIDIGDMQKGQIKRTRWNNKDVAILFRQFPDKLKLHLGSVVKEDLPATFDLKTRSINREYFVYINTGDSHNCPLFYSAGELKDTCSSNTFDETGRGVNNSSGDFVIKIPPHYFEKNTKGKIVVIGKWRSTH